MNDKLNIRRLRVRPVVVPVRLPLQTSTGAVSMAPLVVKDSRVLIPETAGSGIHWDEKAVKKFAA